jgi:hypothetical protein
MESKDSGFSIDVFRCELSGVTLGCANFPQKLVEQISLSILFGAQNLFVLHPGDSALFFEAWLGPKARS